MTFTRAAAASMKEKIYNALLKEMEKHEKDTKEFKRLKEQSVLLASARIMTTDSFCLSILKENIDKIDIDRLRRVKDMLDDEDEEVSDKAMLEAEKILAEIFGNELSPNEIAGLIKQIIEEDGPEGPEEDLSCPDEITDILGLSKGNITYE